MKTIYAIVLSVWLAIPIVPVAAHGTGTSLEQVSGDFIVEFEYDQSGSILAGEQVKYTVFLLNVDDRMPAEFGDAFIQLRNSEGKIVFMGRISQEPGIAGYGIFTLALSDPGAYQSEVTFLFEGSEIASGSFEYQVEESMELEEDNVLTFPVLLFLSGLITGGVFGYLLHRKK